MKLKDVIGIIVLSLAALFFLLMAIMIFGSGYLDRREAKQGNFYNAGYPFVLSVEKRDRLWNWLPDRWEWTLMRDFGTAGLVVRGHGSARTQAKAEAEATLARDMILNAERHQRNHEQDVASRPRIPFGDGAKG